jgi:hypothetical protein
MRRFSRKEPDNWNLKGKDRMTFSIKTRQQVSMSMKTCP